MEKRLPKNLGFHANKHGGERMKDVWEKEEKSNKASKEVRNEQMTVNQRCGWESSHFALSTYMSDSFKKKKKK